MVRAAAGSWWVVLLFFAVLTFVIVRIGCLYADKKTADLTGALFTAITTVMLLVLTALSFAGGGEGGEDGNGTAILKLVLALTFGVIAFLGWRGSSSSPSELAH